MNSEMETRVLVIAEMLDRAVAELKRLATEIKTSTKDRTQEPKR